MEILLIRPLQLWPMIYYESFRQPQEKMWHLLNYRDAQSKGNYMKALQNYYEAMRLEIDPYDRSYILFNIPLFTEEHLEIMEAWFDQAVKYWNYTITLTPKNYIEAPNWLKITGRFE
ncbi:Photosystem I assembly protein Ycf3 [Bienertia sinuspersici]